MALSYKLELAAQIAMFASRLGLVDGYRLLRTSLVKSQVAILAYHRVRPQNDIWLLPYLVTTSDFENQLRYLSRAYEFLSLDKLVEYIYEGKSFPKKAVAITFDDGYKDNYTYAYPILKKYHAPATVFLATGNIDNEDLFWWDKVTYVMKRTTLTALELDEIGTYSLRSAGERLRAASAIERSLEELPAQKRDFLIERLVSISGVDIPPGLGKEVILSWDEVREMSHNGVGIGAHSVTHPRLTEVPLEQAKDEIMQSKKDIEDRLNQPVIAFSYPLGKISHETARFLKEGGFRCAVTGFPRMVTPKSDPYELGRIVAGWTFDVFKFFVSGLYSDLYATWSQIKRR